ncbi:hypothetical protein F4859DRAFT_154255 [Xylaria cf. heliscus]|nr:hypothetical protein F4859DRAFT_154255 [Xylaria cf. heliscus]
MSVEDNPAADTSAAPRFRIVTIPVDEEGCRFYLERYKPFRLASLQQDADAFGSTFAREVALDDAAWLGRIRNPLVTTFVAVEPDKDRVVASTSLIGPLPNANPASNPHQVSEAVAQSNAAANDSKHPADGESLCFQVSGVYTIPEARGQGLAKSLIKAATEEACNQARGQQGRPLVLSVVVYAANKAAISVYERCGFARGAEEPKLVFNALKKASQRELNMYYQGVP